MTLPYWVKHALVRESVIRLLFGLKDIVIENNRTWIQLSYMGSSYEKKGTFYNCIEAEIHVLFKPSWIIQDDPKIAIVDVKAFFCPICR